MSLFYDFIFIFLNVFWGLIFFSMYVWFVFVGFTVCVCVCVCVCELFNDALTHFMVI